MTKLEAKNQIKGAIQGQKLSKNQIKEPSKVRSSLRGGAIDPSILDLKWGRTQKVTTEIHNQEKEEIVVLCQNPQAEP